MPGAAGAHKVAPAGHHRFHRLQLILRLAAGIRPPGGEDKIGVQLRQLFRADVNALAVGDPLNQRRKAEPGVAQHPAQGMIRMMHRDLAIVRLDHRDGVLRRVDHRFQLLDLFLIATLKDRQPRLGAGQLGQLAVNLRGAAL